MCLPAARVTGPFTRAAPLSDEGGGSGGERGRIVEVVPGDPNAMASAGIVFDLDGEPGRFVSGWLQGVISHGGSDVGEWPNVMGGRDVKDGEQSTACWPSNRSQFSFNSATTFGWRAGWPGSGGLVVVVAVMGSSML